MDHGRESHTDESMYKEETFLLDVFHSLRSELQFFGFLLLMFSAGGDSLIFSPCALTMMVLWGDKVTVTEEGIHPEAHKEYQVCMSHSLEKTL